ncbi:MAG: GGDEF domain-containing protein [Thermomonas sp.]|jgi:diguanylate cyclase (GGDEF)-like protein|uniref:GGDEF domain-containing protein n=1 Tax=Thermomonas sp. TaxID=1971895 RepID=UPI001B72833D|nr:GGDEF domain-containing protein [Thermomonas sp.]MBK6334121.1 GGDEF domain-containing protein [Thermomonas sp.]MBK6415769.1 GGDEF domain-containing protein [Thermomonas sp.]MBK6924927.1 GGDEF domain-containing protein [Thermomonas sp.]MBP6439644.1 GGDEF domain-containing protein [Thermomonas sp.]MBP7159255.1 GGDEF domain-containing protein [Thermomonas sp.]
MASSQPPHDTAQHTILSPGPARPQARAARVVVIHGEGLGQRVVVEAAPVLVGRSQEADLVIAHKSVSREHCRIWRDDSGYRVRDLGATNTTRVNDRRIDGEAGLADGDQLTVGESILKFISEDSVEASYHEQIYQLATHDALTELYNRRHFIEAADKEIARALRQPLPLALCIVDVDLFKPVNDRHGHLSGDEVLRQIAAVLRRHARAGDIAARIGGEEFALLLPGCALEAASTFADRLREAVAATAFAPGGEPQRITVSIGIAALGPGRQDRAALMAAADAALYRAKHAGRNQVCVQE